MKKILLFLVAIFMSVSIVNAANAVPEITSELSVPTTLNFYNCADSSTCNASLTTNVILNDATETSVFTTGASIGPAGVRVSVNTGQALQSDYLYSYNFIMCYGATQRPMVDIYLGYRWNTTPPTFYTWTDTTISPAVVNIEQVSISRCYLYSTIFQPNITGDQWLNIRLYNSSLVSSNSIFFVGHNLQSLGIAKNTIKSTIDSSINSAISNSGLASAASVQEVNKAISNMNTEIANKQQETNNKLDEQIQQNQQQIEEQQETNNKLDNLNDNLTNSDSPDNMDGLSNSAGWLPPGPIDSILNLPLSMLNNISDNLNKSCQAVNLPLPFVNKNLPLPCLSSIYSQINGLGPWITTVSVIASAFILFSYLLKLYKWVDDTLTFRENNEIDNWGGL